MRKRLLSLLLLAAMLAALCAPVLAEDGDTVYISDAGGLLAFAESCSYDAWSEGKTVVLQRDISLGGVDFLPIASFGGTFEGGGHTISGLNISADVSPAGLFGTIAAGGVVRELNVEGSVAPGGSAERVGGVAGLNRGVIANCAFVGTVDGEKSVGGIAGENAATGVIRRCEASGGVFGKNMTGGVAGANHGTLASGVNRAYVNTNTLDPSLSLDRLNLDLNNLSSLMSPDSYNVAVDSGGVAGFSDGELIGCRNYGSVGYQHIGYNVGGVVGRSSGHVATCGNDGNVYGRREVGGIAGMAEPYVKLDLSESSVEQVRRELNTLSGLIDKTVNDAEAGAETISARLTAVGDGVDEAATRAQTLTDHLADTYDETVAEVNRGSEILDAALPRLYDISGDLAAASGTFSDGLNELDRALGTLSSSGVSAELSAMADDFARASDIFDRGTKKIQSGLDKLDDSIRPAQGVTEAEWREKIYGENGALQQIWRGSAEAADGISATAKLLSGLAQIDPPANELDVNRYIRDVNEYLSQPDGSGATNLEKLQDAAVQASGGFERMNGGVQDIYDNTDVDFAKMRSGLDEISGGLDILTGANGGNGAFHYISAGLNHLSNAAKDGEASVGSFRSASGTFGGAFAEMAGAMRDAQSLFNYLRRQEKLQFPTLGGETDAEAAALYDSVRDISNNLELLNQEAKSASDAVLEDVRAINRQFTALMNTLLDVVEDAEGASLGAVVEDTSDEDVDAAVSGKLLLCTNNGAVSGDIDVGGIAGAMMIYNELDPESDGDTLSSAIRKRYELKCVLQDCVNNGAVSGKRDNVGSVCGSETLGVISGCEAYGAAESEGGDYVGGIAGSADGVVRKCWSKCALVGGKYVGGIAGGGSAGRSNLRLEDCRALVDVTKATQYAGSILGVDIGALSGNLFVSDTLPGIDRVSERGRAEPVAYEQLLAEDGVPAEFRRFTLSFVADGKTIREMRFRYGDSLPDSAFPEIPELDGQFARWDREDLSDLRFDTTVTAVYLPCLAAVASDSARSASRPTFLIEGAFDDAAELTAQPAFFDFDDGRDDFVSRIRAYRRTLLEQWQLTLPSDGARTHTLRYLPPEGVSGSLELYALSNGRWTRLETAEMGSYLTFETAGEEAALTVVQTATPWWVWALVNGFLLVAAALAAVLLIRRKPKKELTDEEKARAEKRRKRRKKLRVILIAAALLLAAALGAVAYLAPGLTESMGLYMMLRNYAERTDVDMELSLTAHVNGETFETEVTFFKTAIGDKRVGCVMWEDIPLYYCDGVMLLENGRAYRADGILPDYTQLLGGAAGMLRAVDVTAVEENGVKTYHAVARGGAAEQILTTLLPDMAGSGAETEEVTLDLVVTDGEMTSLLVRWNGEAGDAQAEVLFSGEAREHTLPQAVRASITSGEYADAPDIGPAARRLLLAWTELAARDPLSADVTLAANCGPLLLDDKLTWQRTGRYGETLSCLSGRGTTIYYTDSAACGENGRAVGVSRDSLAGAPELLRLAYEAFLLGDAGCTEISGGWRYSVTLDEAAMAGFAGAIAPETKAMDLSLTDGTVQLELRDGAVTAIVVQCKGTVRVVRRDVMAAVSARLAFDAGAAFDEPSEKVLSALGLEG